jgi:hypothetical protein
LAALLACVVVLAVPTSSSASKGLALGIFDDAQVFSPTGDVFPTLGKLNVQVLRMTLTWGGRGGVANSRPAHPADPADPAYDWARYDRAIERASDAGIQPLLTIVGTPAWANGGQAPQRPPSSATTLRQFAYAAASRYSGTFLDTATGRVLPRVSLWLAWNEPNSPVFLQPQFVRAGGKWRVASARAYARICNAVYDGVHAAGGPQRVACGATAPRGSNAAAAGRPSVSPIAFLTAAKKDGLRTFDAWAHHPYYGNPSSTPSTTKVGPRAVELGNIDSLIGQVTKLYGPKPMWITEYGYQTRAPDPIVVVSWARQAQYLQQA